MEWSPLLNHLYWAPSRGFDMSVRVDVPMMYEWVLSHASSASDLVLYVNREKLIALWSAINLPNKVREVWAQRFSELANYVH